MNGATFSKLSIDQLRESLINSLPVYKDVINTDADRSKLSIAGQAWCQAHDRLAWHFGYYGDLDFLMPNYEKSLQTEIYTMTSVEPFVALIDEINAALDVHEQSIARRKKEGWTVIRT